LFQAPYHELLTSSSSTALSAGAAVPDLFHAPYHELLTSSSSTAFSAGTAVPDLFHAPYHELLTSSSTALSAWLHRHDACSIPYCDVAIQTVSTIEELCILFYGGHLLPIIMLS
jgi:hypothetical protein